MDEFTLRPPYNDTELATYKVSLNRRPLRYGGEKQEWHGQGIELLGWQLDVLTVCASLRLPQCSLSDLRLYSGVLVGFQ